MQCSDAVVSILNFQISNLKLLPPPSFPQLPSVQTSGVPIRVDSCSFVVPLLAPFPRSPGRQVPPVQNPLTFQICQPPPGGCARDIASLLVGLSTNVSMSPVLLSAYMHIIFIKERFY